ncbi:MAG: hypothetical protein A3E80_05120 [Chlamydiae bacterium RIFCSPHIGHO2_12_FULL_49_9]|nr:MAG: hypothetical protein A3E80_05120 [Chlamydiae bacterium RIFCSPHIGHO2_12_FULL_49_9]
MCWLRLCQIDLHRRPCLSAMVLLCQIGALPLRFGFASLTHIVAYLRFRLIKFLLSVLFSDHFPLFKNSSLG